VAATTRSGPVQPVMRQADMPRHLGAISALEGQMMVFFLRHPKLGTGEHRDSIGAPFYAFIPGGADVTDLLDTVMALKFADTLHGDG